MISQVYADQLMRMPKIPRKKSAFSFPVSGEWIEIEMVSRNGKEEFIFDINRKGQILLRCTLQERWDKTTVLLRLETTGGPHTNPPITAPVPSWAKMYVRQSMSTPHLHIYLEEYGDRWAFPVPSDRFKNLHDIQQTLMDFFDYCNVLERPILQFGLD